jgi:hypothetical protein
MLRNLLQEKTGDLARKINAPNMNALPLPGIRSTLWRCK